MGSIGKSMRWGAYVKVCDGGKATAPVQFETKSEPCLGCSRASVYMTRRHETRQDRGGVAYMPPSRPPSLVGVLQVPASLSCPGSYTSSKSSASSASPMGNDLDNREYTVGILVVAQVLRRDALCKPCIERCSERGAAARGRRWR